MAAETHQTQIAEDDLVEIPDGMTIWMHNQKALKWGFYLCCLISGFTVVDHPVVAGMLVIVGVMLLHMSWLVCAWVHTFAAYVMVKGNRSNPDAT